MAMMCWMISQQCIPYHLSAPNPPPKARFWAHSIVFSSSDTRVFEISFYGLCFFDSHTSDTFSIASLSWHIFFHTDQVFSTHMLQAHFILCLHRDRFLFIRVGFFQLMHIGHILSCISAIVNFFSYEFDFLNSCISDTFYLVPLSWQIFLYANRVFLTYIPRVHFTLWWISLHTG